jgi:hypothetical protein
VKADRAATRAARQFTDLRYAPIADSDVSAVPRVSRAVDNPAAGKNQFKILSTG